MIERIAENTIRELAKSFKAITITGPRQSSKTTLARTLFNDYAYVLSTSRFLQHSFRAKIS